MESTEIMNEIAQGLEQLANQIDIITDKLRWQLVIAIIIYMVIQILFTIAIVNYAAVKNSETFNYEKLAKAIAIETIKAQAIAAKQQATKEQVTKVETSTQDAVPEPRRYRPPGL